MIYKITYLFTFLFFFSISCAGGNDLTSNNSSNNNAVNNNNNNNKDITDTTDNTDNTDNTDVNDITDTTDNTDNTDVTDVTDTTDNTDTADNTDTTDNTDNTDGGTEETVIILSEVFYNPDGTDDQLEWVEIYNAGTTTVDLSTWSLGYGGTAYTYGTLQLSGTIAPGDCFVVGGPLSGANNGSPVFDLSSDFNPDIQNSGTTADGLALFDVQASLITAATIPVDAVIYGTSNNSNLIDSSGSAPSPHVANASSGYSIRRTSMTTWETSSVLTPNDCSHIILQ